MAWKLQEVVGVFKYRLEVLAAATPYQMTGIHQLIISVVLLILSDSSGSFSQK
ncbi:hypothetical protein [Endozoicomonas sp. 2B-B]